MPRFKTIGFARCENGHENLFDIRLEADSAEVARAYALAEAQFRRCQACDSAEPLTLGQVFSTKEVPLPVDSAIWGYTCHCGQKVEVVRIEPGQTLVPIFPASKAVECSKGHTRVIEKREFTTLEHWKEKA